MASANIDSNIYFPIDRQQEFRTDRSYGEITVLATVVIATRVYVYSIVNIGQTCFKYSLISVLRQVTQKCLEPNKHLFLYAYVS